VRVVALLATIVLASCEALLGIQDPSPAGDGGLGSDSGDAGAAVDHLAFSLGDLTLARGQVARLHVLAVLSDGTTSDATATATYESDNAAVATGAPGAITSGAQAGTATITARLGSARPATVRVTVADIACHPVINELQTGSVTSSSDEWVELYNPCAAGFDVSTWTLVYRAQSNIGVTDTMLLAELTGAMAPGALRIYAGPDYAGANDGEWMGGGSGVLQQNNGGIGLRAGVMDTGPLVDAVAYGTVTAGHPFVETMAAAMLSNGRSAARLPFDGRDGNDGAADFMVVTTPTPRALNAP
jgi:hypothetical protein